jgi:hypothetical protein
MRTPAAVAAATSYGVSPSMTAASGGTPAFRSAAPTTSGSGFERSASSLDVWSSISDEAPKSRRSGPSSSSLAEVAS